MKPLSLEEAVAAVNGRPERRLLSQDLVVQGVSTDSRVAFPGALFFGLIGPTHDGHDYVSDALRNGAVAAVVHRQPPNLSDAAHPPLVWVDDTTLALGDLAAFYRALMPAKRIAITGSVGKSSTKELLGHVLGSWAPTVRSPKSFNNNVGVPKTIFEMEPTHEFAVIEMGTSGFGEIARLVEIAEPTYGLMLNVSEAHLEHFHSLEGVAEAKEELIHGLPTDGVAFLNADDMRCLDMANRAPCRVVTFGVDPLADYRAHVERTNCRSVSFRVEDERIEVPMPGRHNVQNALAAYAVARQMGMTSPEIAKALRTFKGLPMRFCVVPVGPITVIDDAYNANPASMTAALNEFENRPVEGRRLLVCGSMLELGDRSEEFHRRIGARVAELKPDRLWTVGDEARWIADEAVACGLPASDVERTVAAEEVVPSLLTQLQEGDSVLLKGSRRIALEKIRIRLKDHFQSRERRREGQGRPGAT